MVDGSGAGGEEREREAEGRACTHASTAFRDGRWPLAVRRGERVAVSGTSMFQQHGPVSEPRHPPCVCGACGLCRCGGGFLSEVIIRFTMVRSANAQCEKRGQHKKIGLTSLRTLVSIQMLLRRDGAAEVIVLREGPCTLVREDRLGPRDASWSHGGGRHVHVMRRLPPRG